jgi:hypothetical protein
MTSLSRPRRWQEATSWLRAMNGAFQKSPGFPFTAGEFLSALFARVTAILDKKVAGALHVVEHENRRTGHHRIGISIGLRPEIECEIGSRRAASERTSVVFLVCPPAPVRRLPLRRAVSQLGARGIP